MNFLNELLLRTLYVQGVMLGLDLARTVCLPFKVIEESLKFLKDEKCVEVQGGEVVLKTSAPSVDALYRLTLFRV